MHENNFPINLLFNEHAEELPFPQICLGQLRTFHGGLTAIPFTMTTSELRQSDRLGWLVGWVFLYKVQ